MSNIKFKVSTDTYPKVLFQGKSPKEIKELIHENKMSFTCQSLTAERLYSEDEVEAIRRKYQTLIEDSEPVLAQELYEKTEDQKRIVTDAKDRLQAVKTQISDYVSQVKRGCEDFDLDGNKVYRFAVDGQYLYYTVIDKSLILAKIASIPEFEEAELFDAQEANAEVFAKFKEQ